MLHKLTFVQGTHAQGSGWNWLAACWTGGGCGVTTERLTEEQLMDAAIRREDVPEPIFTHVELRFSDGIGTSITSKSGSIHYERRLHTKQNYSFVAEYLLTEDEEKHMQQMASDMHSDHVGFNRSGFMVNFLPVVGRMWAGDAGDGSVFCSEYIIKLLHEANRLLDANPHTTSPQQLYHLMLDEIRDGRAYRSWNREAGAAIRQGLIQPQRARPMAPTNRPSTGRSSLFRPGNSSKKK